MNLLKKFGKALCFAVAGMVGMVSAFAEDPTTLISVGTPPSLSNVVFTPSILVTPIVTIIVAVIGSAAVLWLIQIGVRKIRSFIRG